MNIKIECACGTKFAFEVEPVNGRMPVNVNCPGCNASALELANAEIRRQLASAMPAAPAVAAAPAMPAPAIPAMPSIPAIPAAPGPAAPVGQPRIAIPVPAAAAPAPAAPAPIRVAMPTASAPAPTPAPAVAPAPAPIRVAAAPAPAPAPAPVRAATSPPPQPSGLRISGAAHAPAAAPAPAPAAAPAAAAGDKGLCPKHPSDAAVETCRVCGKPICLKCMQQFGYVCSVYCRQQGEARGVKIPVYRQQKAVIQKRANSSVRRMVYAGVAVAILFLGLWIWYSWFARNPTVVFTKNIPRSDSRLVDLKTPEEYFQLIGPNQLLSFKEKRMTLTDVLQKKELWSVRLQSEAEEAAIKAARAKNEAAMKAAGKNSNVRPMLDPLGFEGDYGYSDPEVIATTNDIWVLLPNKLERFDRQSGATKDVPVKDRVLRIDHTENVLLVVTLEPTGRRVLTQITLPDGGTQTEELVPAQIKPKAPTSAVMVASARTGVKTAPVAANRTAAAPATTAATDRYKTTPKTVAKAPAPAGPKPPAGQKLRTADAEDKLPAGQLKDAATQVADKASGASTPDDDNGDDTIPGYYSYTDPGFIPAGPNVVQFSSVMVEQHIIRKEAMKPKPAGAPGKSVLDSENLTAGQGMQVAQELLNEQRRAMTGGVEEEDQSQYKVTVHRRFANGVADWVGSVTGPPQFIPLKTVDLVTAGSSVYVLDKNNKLLWQAKLPYNVPAARWGRHGTYTPALETKDAVYIADQGTLTKFDLATGARKWGLNSVGISHIQEDAKGRIYVSTTTAGVDSIQYSQQVNIHNKIHPVILRVDAKNGKELWRLQGQGDECIISGKFVYTTMISQTMAFLKLEEGPDTHFNLNLVSPGNGSVIWNFHAGNQHIEKTIIHDNWVMLQFYDEVKILKFWSL